MKSKPAIEVATDAAPRAALIWDLDRREAAILGAILLATLLAYLPSLKNGWVFDDTLQIVRANPLHSWSGIGKSFIYDSWWFLNPRALPQSAYYRPLQATWFGLNYMIFGNYPAAWHLEKIALQLIVVMLCFRLAQLLTRSSTVGLLTAALFAILPANTESVVWVSAIGEPLSTAFEMGALCCFISRKPGWPRGRVFALMLYAGALLSHETAILFAAIVAAYVFLFERNDEGSTARRIVRAVRACAPFVLLAILYMCARVNALGLKALFGLHQAATAGVVMGFVESRPHHSLAQILMTLPMVLFAYLAVLALPPMADPTHSIQWIMHPRPIMFISWAALVLLAAVALVLAWRSSNRRLYLFCAVWSVITIAPALNLNALWYLVDDRYLYAPSFGLSLAAAVAATRIAAAGSRVRKGIGVAIAVFVAACVVFTMKMERYWYDDVAFFQRCVEITPYDPGYRVRLSAAMNKAGDLQGAMHVLERGTVLDPDEIQIHLKLAEQYKMMGHVLDFQREFMKFNELSAARVNRQRSGGNPDASEPAGVP
ncbi:MAG: tetratricopeptide repeat protein [Candidatus Binatus sp.]